MSIYGTFDRKKSNILNRKSNIYNTKNIYLSNVLIKYSISPNIKEYCLSLYLKKTYNQIFGLYLISVQPCFLMW